MLHAVPKKVLKMEILKNIPVPEDKPSLSAMLRKMEVGDCLVTGNASVLSTTKQVRNSKHNPCLFEFKVKTINGKAHVWRVA
jgi:hypothetical protein